MTRVRTLRDISIRAKLSAGLGIAFVLIVIAGVVGLFNLQRLNVSTDEITRTWLPRVKLLGNLKADMVEHWLLAAGKAPPIEMSVPGETRSRLPDVSDAVKRDLRLFEAGLTTPDEKLLFVLLTGVWEQYESLLAKGSLEASDTPAGPALAANLFDRATRRVNDLIAYSIRQSNVAANTAGTIFESALWLTAVAVFLSLIGSIMAIVWIGRNVSGPIARISRAMQLLASGGSVETLSGERERKDEIGTLIAAVDGYQASLARGRALSEAAEQERQRLATAINNMTMGLVMFDGDHRLIIANSRYAEIYQLPARLAQPGTHLNDILDHRIAAGRFPEDGAEPYVARLNAMIRLGQPVSEVFQFADGRIISVVVQPMHGGGWVSTHEDITARRIAEAKIAYMRDFDALTDLPNRSLLRERIDQALARAGRDTSVAVLCLDLDHFKNVNDTLGHPIGDALLLAVAKRLAATTREGDTVARLGADEFVLVQVGVDQPKSARATAQRLIDEIGAAYSLDGQDVVTGVSIGIALGPADGRDADRLMKNADIALHRAKDDGRGVYRFFEPEMDAIMQERRALESDLRRAIEAEEFEVAYQPQFNLASNAISGFEALLRWRSPRRGTVAPLDFIALAEETGLIVPIGEWVLRQACTEAMRWPSRVSVAVNLSAVQFRSARLMAGVIAALAASGLPARRLELEITESTLLAENEATLAVLHQLRALGVRISMDDFGTGYSSLRYLQSFPFDKIKIDRRFVVDINRDPSSLAIIRAVIGLSASLGIVTTAEGVETREQFERVKAEGCTEVQGFLTGRPMSAEQASLLLERPGSKATAA
ncbi:hypothetical protein BH10PSE9_BH10PSE9_01120 [soil metagenome]